MSHFIKPVISRKGRVIVLSGATIWLVAAMVLSATPGGAAVSSPSSRAPAITTFGAAAVVEQLDGADGFLYSAEVINAGGQVFVADRGDRRVIRLRSLDEQKFAAATVFGREGAGPGEYMFPSGVAVDSEGNVFVVDRALQRISKYRPDGTFVRSVNAPGATTVVASPRGDLIVYPVNGPALMQRYSTDLEPGEGILEDTDSATHRARVGVLLAVDSRERLFVLDQADLTLTIYDAEMSPLERWEINLPELRESIALDTRRTREKFPDMESFFVAGIQSMAVDPLGDQIAIAYAVRREPDVLFTRIAWVSVDGELLATEDRDRLVSSIAFLPDGRLMEANKETLVVWNRGPMAAPSADN